MIVCVCIGGAVWYSGVCEQVETAKISPVSTPTVMQISYNLYCYSPLYNNVHVHVHTVFFLKIRHL